MPLLVVAPSVPTGTASTAPFDHYSLLRTTEELLGLAPLLGQAATLSLCDDSFRISAQRYQGHPESPALPLSAPLNLICLLSCSSRL